MGYGVEDPAHGIHDDEEYLYVVGLLDPDVVDPDESGDWLVNVSEQCGVPRWTGPTDEAFDRARWQFEGALSAAAEEPIASSA